MITVTGIALMILLSLLFFKQAKFGEKPEGERLDRVEASPNYRNDAFQNLSNTPDLAEGASMIKVMFKFFFNKSPRNKPKHPVPTQKHSLFLLPKENVLVWFGHSSYFIQADGKTILTDPVFSGAASPIKATTRAFPGSDAYTVADFPDIDYLYISHDHWDHLDYETILQLKTKVKNVITGLGTGAHLERWGYDPAIIKEGDWYDSFDLEEGFKATITPGRHFSGRALKRNDAIWTSLVLQTPTFKLFLGGDSGYDTHFKAIGEKYGPFDLAILECGQYNHDWKYIHMMPGEVVTAAKDLGAKKLFPVHWAKFALALHDWDEPIIRVTAEAAKEGMPYITPMIGERVNLNHKTQFFTRWWEGLDG